MCPDEVRNFGNCISDGGRPSEAGMRVLASNQPMLLHSKDVVVSDAVPFNALKPADIAKLKFWDLKKISNSRGAWLSRFQEEVAAN